MELSAMLIEFDMYVDGNNVKMKLDDELVVRLKENLSEQHDEISSKILKDESDFVDFGDSFIKQFEPLVTPTFSMAYDNTRLIDNLTKNYLDIIGFVESNIKSVGDNKKIEVLNKINRFFKNRKRLTNNRKVNESIQEQIIMSSEIKTRLSAIEVYYNSKVDLIKTANSKIIYGLNVISQNEYEINEINKNKDNNSINIELAKIKSNKIEILKMKIIKILKYRFLLIKSTVIDRLTMDMLINSISTIDRNLKVSLPLWVCNKKENLTESLTESEYFEIESRVGTRNCIAEDNMLESLDLNDIDEKNQICDKSFVVVLLNDYNLMYNNNKNIKDRVSNLKSDLTRI